MQKARDEDTIHKSQYGGVPGSEAQTVTLLEELRLDYSLLTGTPYSNLDNDMTACYDRILMPISSMASKSFGIYQDIIFVHAQTLDKQPTNSKYRTK